MTQALENYFRQPSFLADTETFLEIPEDELQLALTEIDRAQPTPQPHARISEVLTATLSKQHWRDTLHRFLTYVGGAISTVEDPETVQREFLALVERNLNQIPGNTPREQILDRFRLISEPREILQRAAKHAAAQKTAGGGHLQDFQLSLLLAPVIGDGQVEGMLPMLAIRVDFADANGHQRTFSANVTADALSMIGAQIEKVREQMRVIGLE